MTKAIKKTRADFKPGTVAHNIEYRKRRWSSSDGKELGLIIKIRPFRSWNKDNIIEMSFWKI